MVVFPSIPSYLIGCANVIRLGMENETIRDSQIDASSLNAVGNPAPQARLNLQSASPLLGSWIALAGEQKPWLKVDFLAYAKITSIETQGRPDSASFVDKFTLSYSNNNDNFTPYKEMGIVKVIQNVRCVCDEIRTLNNFKLIEGSFWIIIIRASCCSYHL